MFREDRLDELEDELDASLEYDYLGSDISWLRSRIVAGENSTNVARIYVSCYDWQLEALRYLVAVGVDIRVVQYSGRICDALDVFNCLKYVVSAGAVIEPIPAGGRITYNEYYRIASYLVMHGTPRDQRGPRTIRYMQLCCRMAPKLQGAAARRVYFWWVPRCYGLTHRSGRRARARNFRDYRCLGVAR